MRLRTGAIELSDAIGSALRRAGKILAEHRTQVVLQPDLPMLDLDEVLFEQVLFNLLDNAGKYAPAGSLITLKAWQDGGHVVVQVLDEGAGHSAGRSGAGVRQVLPRRRRRSAACRHRARPRDLPRLRRGDARHASRASNRTDRSGAVFTMTLPVFVEAETAGGERSNEVTTDSGPLAHPGRR